MIPGTIAVIRTRCDGNDRTDPTASGSSNLLWKLGLHLLLQSAEEEGAEHLMQAADDQDGLLLVQVHLRREKDLC